MKTNETLTPAANWSLDRLGTFATTLEKKMALDAWLLGKTLSLAKERCKKDGVMFTDWKEQYLSISDASVSRYMRVFESFPEDEAEGKLKQLTLSLVYEEVGCDPHKSEKSRVKAKGKSEAKPEPKPKKKEEDQPPVWAARMKLTIRSQKLSSLSVNGV